MQVSKELFESHYDITPGEEWDWYFIGIRYGQLKRLEELFEIVSTRLKDKKSIIDLACGNGHFLKLLHKKYPHIDLAGLEISDNACKIAASKVPTASFMCQDLSVPLKTRQKFDIVTCFEALYILGQDDRKKAAKNISQLMKKDGIAFISGAISKSGNYFTEQEQEQEWLADFKVKEIIFQHNRIYNIPERYFVRVYEILSKSLLKFEKKVNKKTFMNKVEIGSIKVALKLLRILLSSKSLYYILFFLGKNLFPKLSRSSLVYVLQKKG